MILCSGTFDGLHDGHLGYLQAAAYLFCREVTVALAPDDYIRKVKKREPHLLLHQRIAAVKKVWGVERVLVHSAEGAQDVLVDPEHQWKAFVKGKDWYGKVTPAIQQACEARKIALVFVESGSDRHTSTR